MVLSSTGPNEALLVSGAVPAVPPHIGVVIDGRVERVSADESDAYFASRPRGSQTGAWASPQSRPLANREALESELARVEARFPDAVPRPPHWGGFRVTPTRVEFWQGRENRLHDRVLFTPADSGWTKVRLAP